MLDKINILNHIDEILYRLTDENGNILYPTVEFEKEKFNNIASLTMNDNVIYNDKYNKWYEFHKKSFSENGKKYVIEYLIDITLLKEKEKYYQTDSLTNVLTRATILNKVQNELFNCFKDNIPFSIIIGDIDLFKEAISNDLNTSNMITILYDVLKDKSLTDAAKLYLVEQFDKVLSLDLLVNDKTNDALEEEIISKIEMRNTAKKNKDFQTADAIRDELLQQGIRLIDTREGTTFERI